MAAASLLGGQNQGGYGGYHRHRRDLKTRNENLFHDLEKMDFNDCGKLYLCQLSTDYPQKITKSEKILIEALKAPEGQIRLESASGAFEAAIELGFKHKKMRICEMRYPRCTNNVL